MDNVSTGRDQVADLARLLGALGGPGVQRIAAGHFVTCRAHGPAAAERGFEVLDGGRRPQGADRLLLRRASRQAKNGARHFWVASNDGAFSQVARLGPLTVLTLDETRVSARLRAAAIAGISLRRTEDEWRVQYAGGTRFGDVISGHLS
jgi:hypothetical protein